MSVETEDTQNSVQPTAVEEGGTTITEEQDPVSNEARPLIDSTSDPSSNQPDSLSGDKMDVQDPTISESNAKNEDTVADKEPDKQKTVPVVDLTEKDDDSPQKPQPSDLKSSPEKGANECKPEPQREEAPNFESKDGDPPSVDEKDQKTPSTSKPPVTKTPHSNKRYVYKLKAKSGRVLQYTSTVPIVLKKPVIKLTKMEPDDSSKAAENETDDLDSDNSTKENIKKNEESNAAPRMVRKRGRPPLKQRPPVITLDDRNSSDTADSKDESRNTPFTMQTRKRQLKFLPDGRLVTPGKKSRTVESDTPPTSDSDVETDEEWDLKNKKANAAAEAKKPSPAERSANEKKGKFKKVFDYESFFREKTCSPLLSGSQTAKPKSMNTIVEKQNNSSISVASSSGKPASKKPNIDPAQLLSSLIGVPIAPHQLNIVKFKPKVIQERTPRPVPVAPKRVSFQNAGPQNTVTPNSSELLKNTPYKVVSKQTFQKILPKPITLSPDKGTPIVKTATEKRFIHTSTPLSKSTPTISKSLTFNKNTNEDLISKFGNFTDTRVVKTKAGPKKHLQKKKEDSPKTVYDLMENVFDRMPSWNLHVIPDTNSLCIAQVSRGRMGIPILKKSIELNSEFFAKVYVHQLHCKRFDGIYDTENKILTLLKEIDALAA